MTPHHRLTPMQQSGGSPEALQRLADGTYGSDDVGLVWAYGFECGQVGRVLGSDEASRLVGAGMLSQSFLWLHFNLSNSNSERWLRQHLDLSNAFYSSLKEHPSTRVEVVGEVLVAVIRDVQFFDQESSPDATVTLSVSEALMVSARSTQLRSVDRLRAAVRAGGRFGSPIELLAHLLRDQADVLMEIVRDATKRVDGIEDTLFGSTISQNRSKLGVIRRRLVRLQRVLAPEPATLFRLLNRPPGWLRESDIADLRRSAEELSAAVADSGAVIERVRILQDDLSAQLDEATNRTLYILTILTAIAAPFEFISQLFGMSVGGVPFHENPNGFLIVFVLILSVIGLGAVLVRRLMRSS